METNLHDYMCVPRISFEHFFNLSSNLSLFKESRDHVLCRSKQPRHHNHIAKLSRVLLTKSHRKTTMLHHHKSQLPPWQQSVANDTKEPKSLSPHKVIGSQKLLKAQKVWQPNF